jgi:hypothetical protein
MEDDAEEDMVGEDLLPLVLGPAGEQVAAALVGCRYYRDDPDDAAVIVSCERNGRLVLRGNDGRRRGALLAAGFVLPAAGVRQVLDDALGPDMRREQQQRAVLSAFGLTARVEQQDLAPLCAAIAQARGGGMPERDERVAVIAMVQKYGVGRQVEMLCKLWLGNGPSSPPGDVLIALVDALRHTGKIGEALARTDILKEPGSGLARGETGVLFCQRAALWLDLYEHARDPGMLSRARQSAARSWAIGPSEPCGGVYRRLEKLESELR